MTKSLDKICIVCYYDICIDLILFTVLNIVEVLKMKGKKILSLALVMAMLLSAILLVASCSSGLDDTKYAIISENNLTDDGLVYSVYENNTVLITGRQVGFDELIIPDEIRGYPVVEIGAEAFSGDEALVLLTIGKNVKIIGENAFAECPLLARVQVSDALRKVDSGAFYACPRLAEFIGAKNLDYIEEVAFYNCSALAYFDFSNNLTKVGNEAFSGCESLTKVVLPAKVKDIGLGAFSYCSSLTKVTMPNLKNIPDRLFLNCISLDKVTVPTSVENIGAHAFRGCSKLKTIYVPKSVKTVGEACFAQCEALKNVKYTGSAGDFKKITFGAENVLFSESSVEYNQKLPTSGSTGNVTVGGDGKFTVPEKIISDDTIYTEGVYKYALYDDKTAIITEHTGDEIEIVVPNTLGGYPVVSIASGAFYGNLNATSVKMGDNMQIIGSSAFNGCVKLEKVEIPKSVWAIYPDAFTDTPWYNSLTKDEFVIVGDSVLLKYNGTESSVVIPNNVKHTSAAFMGNETIKEVIIPDSVYTIGCATFSSSSVSRVEMGNNVVLIGDSAFAYCYELHYVNIPESVKTIEAYAFSSCAGLNYLKIGKNVKTIDEYAFFRSTQFSYIYLPKSVKTIGDFAFEDCNYLSYVYYEGATEDFTAFGLDGRNARLTDAKKFYNYNYAGGIYEVKQ